MRDRIFFVLSGEHPSLPKAEIRAILHSSKLDFKEVASAPKLLRAEADDSALEVVSRRSLMYDQCGIELISTEPDRRQFFSKVRGLNLTRHFPIAALYAVRSLRIGGAFRQFQRTALERELGKILQTKQQGVRVDLDYPDVTFLCIVSQDGFLLGKVTHSRVRGIIASRRPRKRPVFHPSTMPPKLARCLVNLARPTEGDTLLDPFCGVGGVLLEGAAIGCKVVGVDVDPRMIKGARRNLSHYGTQPFGLIVGDAIKVPLNSTGSIVTDPPYGREASTRGRKLGLLLREFLPSAYNVLSGGGHLCICCPSDIQILGIARRVGFELVESHTAYVHRSLTRRILVLRRKQRQRQEMR